MATPPPDDAAAQQAAQTAESRQTAETRTLASSLDTAPQQAARVVKAAVTAVNLAGTPPTVSVQLEGDTTTTIDSVRFVDSYTPVVGDTCLAVRQDADLFVLGQMNDTGTGAANGWQTPGSAGIPALTSGFTTNGNSNGPVQFRLKVDDGDNKLVWKGSVAVSGTPTSLFAAALPAAYRPAFDRTIAVARDSGGGANTVLVTFKSDGTVVLSGTTAAPAAASVASGSTAPGAGGAPSTNTTGDPGNISTGAPSVNTTTDPGGLSTGAPNTNTTGSTSGSTGGASTVATDNAATFYTNWDSNPSGATATHYHGIDSVGNPHNHGHAHTHAVNSHAHDLQNHFHTTGGHTHGMQNHFHTIGGHTHDMASHTHAGAAHTHTVQPTLSVTAPVWISFNDVEYYL